MVWALVPELELVRVPVLAVAELVLPRCVTQKAPR
jgi:hypothetical protein